MNIVYAIVAVAPFILLIAFGIYAWNPGLNKPCWVSHQNDEAYEEKQNVSGEHNVAVYWSAWFKSNFWLTLIGIVIAIAAYFCKKW